MATRTSGFTTYTDVAGVIAATPAGQVVTVRDALLAAIGNAQVAPAVAGGGVMDEMTPSCNAQVRLEITTAFAAIAAAPTS